MAPASATSITGIGNPVDFIGQQSVLRTVETFTDPNTSDLLKGSMFGRVIESGRPK